MGVGDSKTSPLTSAEYGNPGWLRYFLESIRHDYVPEWRYEARDSLGVMGATVNWWEANYGSTSYGLGSAKTVNATHVAVNIGVNDVRMNWPLVEANWKAAYRVLLAAIHAKWPGAKVYLGKPWGITYGAKCDTIAGWIDDLVAEETWLYAGADERGASGLESTDDGATYYVDGIHYSAAGEALVAQLWRTAMGI